MAGRPLHELLDQQDPLWPHIEGWLAAAPRTVEVLPVAREQAEATLLTLNVTTRSPLGAMAYHTGGILVDQGWLRLLGASGERMCDGLLAWNRLAPGAVLNTPTDAFVVAHDAVGGFFAANHGAFAPVVENQPSIFYLPPDTLEPFDTRLSYTTFLEWALTGPLDRFYVDLRWPGWEDEVAAVTPDQGINFYPMLWAAGAPLVERSRRPVRQRELWGLYRDFSRQIAHLPPGTSIRIRWADDSPTPPADEP